MEDAEDNDAGDEPDIVSERTCEWSKEMAQPAAPNIGGDYLAIVDALQGRNRNKVTNDLTVKLARVEDSLTAKIQMEQVVRGDRYI